MTLQPLTDTTRPRPLSAVPTGLPEPMRTCPADIFDGWVVHHAALSRGLNTLLFPGQALMAYYGDDHTSGAAFAHGVPNQTWLSTATLVQDKRIRRDVLAAAGIAVPRGRGFSLKRGLPYAKEFAAEIGYPVVVKPVVGESTIEVMSGIDSEASLVEAVNYLHQVPTIRPDFTTASYAFTQILTPRTGTSTRTRGTYRYLVEEHISGESLRVFVAGGTVLSVISTPHGPWGPVEDFTDVTLDVHTDILAFAQSVWDALPGLAVMALDLVVDDATEALTDANRAIVVDVAERPWLHVQQVVSSELATAHAQTILESSTDIDLRASSSTESVDAAFRWDGLSQVDVDIERAAAAARRLGLEFDVTSQDEVAGVVSGRVSGPARVTALLTELVVDGDILTSPAMCAETRPMQGQGTA